MRKLKYLALALAVLLISVNAYAVRTPQHADVKNAEDDSNTGRDFIDTMVQFTPNDNWELIEDYIQAASTNTATFYASEGAVVIWATQPNAVLGRDVSYTVLGDDPLVAGIVSESGGITSGSYGRMRIYGYFDDVLIADSVDGVSAYNRIATAQESTKGDDTIGLCGLAPETSTSSVGMVFGDGSSNDGDLVPSFIQFR